MWDNEDVIMRSKSAAETDINNCSLCADTGETDMFVLNPKLKLICIITQHMKRSHRPKSHNYKLIPTSFSLHCNSISLYLPPSLSVVICP